MGKMIVDEGKIEIVWALFEKRKQMRWEKDNRNKPNIKAKRRAQKEGLCMQ